jgi:hypothetical protein
MISCHGTYIDDYRDRRPGHQQLNGFHPPLFELIMRRVPYRVAWEFLRASDFVPENLADYPGDDLFRRSVGLINKGWAVISIQDDTVAVLYNHDGEYRLYSADVEAFQRLVAEQARPSAAMQLLVTYFQG